MSGRLKNITFSASEELIGRARDRARAQNVSLSRLFRSWLMRYAGSSELDYRQLMTQLNHVNPGRKFSREELNER